jgi:hypothetical protein
MTFFVLAASLVAQAEDPGPAISTDRPSFSDSRSIVSPLRLQLEAGYTFTTGTMTSGLSIAMSSPTKSYDLD